MASYDELEHAVELMNQVRQAMLPNSGYSGVQKLIMEFYEAVRMACQRAGLNPIASAQNAAKAEKLKDLAAQDPKIIKRGQDADDVLDLYKQLGGNPENKPSYPSPMRGR